MSRYLSSNKDINEYLIRMDNTFKEIINTCKFVDIELADDYFVKLSESIIGQQLSNKVSNVICQRLHKLCEYNLTPESIVFCTEESLRSIGISYSKIGYLKNLAHAIENGNVSFMNIENLSNSVVIDMLSSVKGIGKWTAEMFLIFALGREDVFSSGDGGLQRAMFNFYNGGNPLEQKQINQISNVWSPYRSYASLYLWKSLDTK